MSTWFPPLRAKVLLVFWAALAVIGAVPVLYCAGLVAWQFAGLFPRGSWVALPATLLFTEHSFAFVPGLGWAWFMSPDSLVPVHKALIWMLGRVHAGAIFAVVGAGFIALGILGVRRQYAAIRAQRQRREDSLRRVRDYRDDDARAPGLDGRREPFISKAGSSRAAAGGAR